MADQPPRRLAYVVRLLHAGSVDSSPAVSIHEAASLLGVSKPRVHQLLNAGALSGPTVTGRAPAGVPRVWRTSLNEELQRRRVGPGASRRRERLDQPDRQVGSEAPSVAPVDPAVEATREAAFRLKIALDAARDALNAERAQTRQVTKVLAETVAMLAEQQRLTDRADELTNGYADALTQLLGPEDVGSVTQT